MNWDALATIGELVSAFAVVVTLIYLAIQFRQTRVAAAADANRAIITDFQRIWTDAIGDKSTNLIVRRAMNNWDSLSKSDQLTAHVFLTNLVTHFNTTMSMESATGGDTYDAWENSVLGFVGTAGGQEWYAISRYLFKKGVRGRIDLRLKDQDTLPPPVTEMPFWQLDDDEKVGA